MGVIAAYRHVLKGNMSSRGNAAEEVFEGLFGASGNPKGLDIKWRVDDPIGQNVDFLTSIANAGIGPGGHQYYWKENPVCAKLWSVIRNEHPASSARAGAEAAE